MERAATNKTKTAALKAINRIYLRANPVRKVTKKNQRMRRIA